MLENELSFLVKTMPDLSGIPRKDIEQHYLSDGIEPLRLRRSGGTFELTKKLNVAEGDLSRREEITVPLDLDEYRLLLPLAKRGLTKTRHYLRLSGGLTAELDVFHGALEGLAMVEVEFSDERSRAAFVPPKWFGRDVSQEEWSSNAFLAGKTFAAIRKHVMPKKVTAKKIRNAR
jgi:adenylate cyclase